MNSWTPFEHLIWRNITQCGLAETENFLLAVSGGLDSMALLHVFQRIKPSANIEIVHFHHGNVEDKSINSFRDASLSLVSEAAEKHGRLLKYCKSETGLVTEDECRIARWNFINRVKTDSCQVVVTAHHQDDRLETMILKLIRGTGPEGLSAFRMWNNEIFRPFLNVSKNELLTYAETNKLRWIDDPGNSSLEHLRSWLRSSWLPDLERRVPGSLGSLARSLDNLILASTEIQPLPLDYYEKGLSRTWFNLLPKEQQLRALALYLREHKVFEFTSGQLTEIRKRLDKNQKDITFDLVGKKWVINATQIMLS